MSSGPLSHYSVLNPVCSGLKAEIEFGEISFPLRVHRLLHTAVVHLFRCGGEGWLVTRGYLINQTPGEKLRHSVALAL